MIFPFLLLFADPLPDPVPADELRHDGTVNPIVWSPDNKTIITGTLFGTVTVWDARTSKEITKLPGHKTAITALAARGKTLVTADATGGLFVWDLPTRKLLRTLDADKAGVRGVAISPDGKTLVGVANDVVCRWDLTTGKALTSWRVGDLKEGLQACAFTPDGSAVYVGGRVTLNEGTTWAVLHSVDVTTGKVSEVTRGSRRNLAKEPLAAVHVTCITHAPDGKTWAFALEDRVAIVTGRLGKSAHGWGVCGVAFLPDGKAVVSADIDGNVLFSDTAGKQLARVKDLGKLTGLALSPDGKRYAVSRQDGKVLLRSVPALRKD